MKINKNNYPLLKDYHEGRYNIELMAYHKEILRHSDYLKIDYIRHISDDNKTNPEYISDTIVKSLNDKSIWKFLRRCWGEIKSQKGLFLDSNRISYYYDFDVSDDRKQIDITIISILGNTILAYLKGVHALEDTVAGGMVLKQGGGAYTENTYFDTNDEYIDVTHNAEKLPKEAKALKDMIYALLVFKQFCPIKTKTLVPRVNTKIKMLGEYVKNEEKFKIDVLDATWYTNLITSMPFEVRPYLRWQKKDGIYQVVAVNGHMKTMTRKAKKLKDGLD
jgi:hypothetical protein